jgi:hypothetical protein
VRRISSDALPQVNVFEKVYHLDTSDVYASRGKLSANPATVGPTTDGEGNTHMASQTDTVQEVAETAVHHLSNIASILATAARDVVHELGELLNDVAQIPAKPTTPPAEAPVEE